MAEFLIFLLAVAFAFPVLGPFLQSLIDLFGVA